MLLSQDQLDKLTDAEASIQAFMDPTSGVDVFGAPETMTQTGALDKCLIDLAVGIASAQSLGITESASSSFVLDALLTPFEDASAAMAVLFMPDPADVGEDPGIGSIAIAMAKSLGNPLQAALAMQANVLDTSFTNLGKILYNDSAAAPGVTQQIGDRLSYILRTLIADPTKNEVNLAGLLFFAVDMAIPAIEDERTYIRRMRKALDTLLEEVATAPPSMVPHLPNLEAIDHLCKAESALNRVKAQLHGQRNFSKPEFGTATDEVGLARDVIYSGQMGKDFANHLKNLFGLSDLQANSLTKFKFLPSYKYRASMIELTFWHNALQREDPAIRQLFQNLLDVYQAIDALSGLHLADVLEQIMEILRRQIHSVRVQLEADASGFQISDVDWDAMGVPTPDTGKAGGAFQSKPSSGSIYSYAGNQVAAYAQLSALYAIMRRVQQIQAALQRILDANTGLMTLLKRFLGEFSPTACGDPNGAKVIEAKLKAVLEAADERLMGKTRDNGPVIARARELKAALDKQDAFLLCFRDKLFFGRSGFMGAVLEAVAIYRAIKLAALLYKRGGAAIREAMRTAALMLQNGTVPTNYLDVMVHALQCFILQCNNPQLSALAKYALSFISTDADKEKAKRISMSALDDVPRSAGKVGINKRLAALLKLILALQRLTSMDINALCNIDTKVKVPLTGSVKPAGPTDSNLATTQTEADKKEAARQQAADAAVSLGTNPP